MKKLFTYLAGITLIFSMGVSVAMAFVVIESVIPCVGVGKCVYVDDSYNGIQSPNGEKSRPFNTIGEAVDFIEDVANPSYDTIIIAGGDYGPSASFPDTSMPWEFAASLGKTITIIGGYSDWDDSNGGFSDFDPKTYRTKIDAGNALHVVVFNSVGGVINGLDISGIGGSLGASPVYISNDSALAVTVDVKILNNYFHDNNTNVANLGVNVQSDFGNTATVSNNDFYDNQGTLSGVIYASGDVDVYNNIIYSNNTDAVLACDDGAMVYNNYILDNDVNIGIRAFGNCDVYNNTVARNTINSVGTDNAAVAMSNNGNKVVNNLITHNSGNEPFVHEGADTSTFEYNALYANAVSPVLTDNNKSCDPLYSVSSGTTPDSVKLGEGSECIDAGKVVSSVSDDYYGTSRPIDGDGAGGAQYDPGAYEAPEAVTPDPGAAPVISGLSVSPSTFSPDGDGTNDTTAIAFNIDNNADVTVSILNSSDVEIKKIMNSVSKSSGAVLTSWDGENDLSQLVDDGTYTVKVEISNTDGSDTEEVGVVVDTATAGDDLCAGYIDVSASHVDCTAIEYVQSTGAMTGNPDGTFAPYDFLQRDQIAKISLQSFGLFNSSSDYCNGVNPFPDVISSDWAYQYICRGVNLNMITGYEAGADAGFYRPVRSVNRVEFLALILRNLSEDMPSMNSSSYNDVESGQWYSGYAKYSYDNSLFTGNSLYPTNFTTRVEVAKVLYKLDQLGKI